MNGARDPFARLVVALEPWLDRIVIIGGWAHQLYRLHPSAQKLDYPPLMTLDTDVAVPPNIPVEEHDIRVRLLAHGFREELLSDDHPPATHYHLIGKDSELYVEFLAPLFGSRYDRGGEHKATVEIAGVSAQQLRHLELLLQHPWPVDFIESDGFAVKLLVANPVSFIAQKILVHKTRGREDRAKDILYIHDTFEVFGARLHELQELWKAIVVRQLNAGNARKVSGAAKGLFGELSDDIRRAAQISDQRALSPEVIREACQYGFMKVFGQAGQTGS